MKNNRNQMDTEPRCCDNQAICLSFDRILGFETFRLFIKVRNKMYFFIKYRPLRKPGKAWFRLSRRVDVLRLTDHTLHLIDNYTKIACCDRCSY